MGSFWQTLECRVSWFCNSTGDDESDSIRCKQPCETKFYEKGMCDRGDEQHPQRNFTNERFEPCHLGDGALSGVEHPLWPYVKESGGGGNLDPSWLSCLPSVEQDRPVGAGCLLATRHGCNKVDFCPLARAPLELQNPVPVSRNKHKGRRVSFDTKVDIICFAEHASFSYTINQCDRQKCCRSLWHEFGQVANSSQWEKVLAVYQMSGNDCEDGRGQLQHGQQSLPGLPGERPVPWDEHTCSSNDELSRIMHKVQPLFGRGPRRLQS